MLPGENDRDTTGAIVSTDIVVDAFTRKHETEAVPFAIANSTTTMTRDSMLPKYEGTSWNVNSWLNDMFVVEILFHVVTFSMVPSGVSPV
jgi:hypothetical protein